MKRTNKRRTNQESKKRINWYRMKKQTCSEKWDKEKKYENNRINIKKSFFFKKVKWLYNYWRPKKERK